MKIPGCSSVDFAGSSDCIPPGSQLLWMPALYTIYASFVVTYLSMYGCDAVCFSIVMAANMRDRLHVLHAAYTSSFVVGIRVFNVNKRQKK